MYLMYFIYCIHLMYWIYFIDLITDNNRRAFAAPITQGGCASRDPIVFLLLCDQVNQLDPVHQLNKVEEGHQVHQVDLGHQVIQ